LKRLSKTIIAAFILPALAVGAEISETNHVLEGKTNFYTQSSAGAIITCGIEFDGIDKNLNYFSGSYNITYFERHGPLPFFKIRSSNINLNGAPRINTIINAWIQSNDL